MSSYGRRDSRPTSVEDKRGMGGQKPGEELSKVGRKKGPKVGGDKKTQQTSRPDMGRIRSTKESIGGLGDGAIIKRTESILGELCENEDLKVRWLV